jgi:hypothetical protein
MGAPEGAACIGVGTCAAGVCVTPSDVTRVRIRAARSGDDGSIAVKGTFDTFPPDDADFGAAGGITVRVTDGLDVDSTATWAAADCVTFPRGGIRCTGADGPRKARFKKRRGSATLWRFTLRMKRFTFQGPFRGPVTLAISDGTGIARQGAIVECTTSASNGALNCRKPFAP